MFYLNFKQHISLLQVMSVNSRYETLGKKGFLTPSRTDTMNFMSSLVPNLIRVKWRKPRSICGQCGFVSQLREHELRRPHFFIVAISTAANLYSSLSSGQTNIPVSQKVTVSLTNGCFHTSILENIVQNKRCEDGRHHWGITSQLRAVDMILLFHEWNMALGSLAYDCKLSSHYAKVIDMQKYN